MTGSLCAAVFKASCRFAFVWIKLTDFRRSSADYRSVPSVHHCSSSRHQTNNWQHSDTQRTANRPRLLDTDRQTGPKFALPFTCCKLWTCSKIQKFQNSEEFQATRPVPVAARSKAKVYGRSQIVGSDPAGGVVPNAVHPQGENRGEWDASGTWHEWKKIEMCVEFWSGKRKERDHIKEKAHVRGYHKMVS